MAIAPTHISALIYRHLSGTISSSDDRLLQEWVASSPEHQRFLESLEDGFDPGELIRYEEQYDQNNTAKVLYQKIIDQITFATPSKDQDKHSAVPVHRVHFLKTAWFRWAAAILILIGAGTYIFVHTSKPDNEVAQQTPSLINSDVLPGSDRAVLTLSTGQQVQLNDRVTETIKDGQLNISHNSGHLSYKNADVVSVNTMTTPRGGQFQLTLADGTEVWLNAASSITFPTAFKDATREVSVMGEAYFDVAVNKEKPFVVKTLGENITVLGTEFNVNNYPDEGEMKTSLVNGAIKVKDKILKPGEAYAAGKIIQTNIDQDVAWKKGIFNFQNIPLEQAMRQLGRWYDVDVEYKGQKREIDFKGKMDRALTLQEVLSGFQGIGGLHFQLKGKTIIIDYK